MKILSRALSISVKNPRFPIWWRTSSGKCWLNVLYDRGRIFMVVYIKDKEQTIAVHLPRSTMRYITNQLQLVRSDKDNKRPKWYVTPEELKNIIDKQKSEKNESK